MKKNRQSNFQSALKPIVAVLAGLTSLSSHAQDLAGQWYGTWDSPSFPVGLWASETYSTGSIIEVSIFGDGNPYFARLYWYIAVDEQVAQSIDAAFAELEARGWLAVGTREVKFDGHVLAEVLEPGASVLAVTGTANGAHFQESAVISVR